MQSNQDIIRISTDNQPNLFPWHIVRNIEVQYLTARQVVNYDVEIFEERI